MNSSNAVVYIASPDARQSRFVKGELALAAAMKLRVFPLWIRGDDWHDCAPIELLHTQYVDLRNEKNWRKAIKPAIEAIQGEISRDLPDAFEIKPLWMKTRTSSNSITLWQRLSAPAGFIKIDFSTLGNDKFDPEWNIGLFVRAKAFTDIGSLLDEMYLLYLSSRFDPFTYGVEWTIRKRDRFMSELILPPDIGICQKEDAAELLYGWRQKGLTELGLAEGYFECAPFNRDEAVLIALRGAEEFRSIQYGGIKFMWSLFRSGRVLEVNATSVPADLPFKRLVHFDGEYDFRRRRAKVNPGTAIIQVNEISNHWF
jgi:hypothetical protein